MKNTTRKALLLIMALLMTVTVASCGGGGGGGTTTSPVTNNPPGDTTPPPGDTTSARTVTLSGTINSISAARTAGRSATAVLSTTKLKAYRAGDTSFELLNSSSDYTESDGTFSIDVDLGSNSALDVIVEAVVAEGSTSNAMIAFDNLAADQSNLAGNTGTTRKALLFHYAVDQDADVSLDTTITNIDNIFNNEGIDLRKHIRQSKYSDSATRASELITQMNSVMTNCTIDSATLDANDKSCIANQIGISLASSNDSADVKNMLGELEDEYWEDLGYDNPPVYISLSGTMQSGSTGVADTRVKVFEAGESSKSPLLNSSSDTTDSSGNFDVVIKLGSAASVDVIVEAAIGTADSGNIFIALEDLSETTTGLAGNEDSSRKALMYHYVNSVSLDIISVIDDLFDDVNIDLRDYIIGTDYSSSESLTSDLLRVMMEVVDEGACNITSDTTIGTSDKDCMQAEITTQVLAKDPVDDIEEVVTDLKVNYRVNLGIDTNAENLRYIDLLDGSRDLDLDAIETLGDIFDEVDSLGCTSHSHLNNSDIANESEASEIVSASADAISAWNVTYSSIIEKRVAIKDEILATFFEDQFTNDDVRSIIKDLRDNTNEGYSYQKKISSEAAGMSSSVSEADMLDALVAYDNFRGMLIYVKVNDVGATKAESAASVEAMLEVLAALGEASEDNDSLAAIFDDWVIEWDKPSVEADLMTALAPLDMDEPDKTENLMLLAHDLNDLPENATDEQIEDVLNDYLTQDTTDVAMDLLVKYRTQTCTQEDYLSYSIFPLDVNLNLTHGDACLSKEDIVLLMETHYEKDLPKLEAYIDGIEAYIESVDSSTERAMTLTGIVFAFYSLSESETPAFQAIYNAMGSNKEEVGSAVDAAGIKKELFWLAMNLSPYIAVQ